MKPSYSYSIGYKMEVVGVSGCASLDDALWVAAGMLYKTMKNGRFRKRDFRKALNSEERGRLDEIARMKLFSWRERRALDSEAQAAQAGIPTGGTMRIDQTTKKYSLL